MKKTIFSLLMLFGITGIASAQTLTVSDVETLPSKTANLVLQITAPANTYTGAQLTVKLPETGFTISGNEDFSGWVGSLEANKSGDVWKIAAAGSKAFEATNITIAIAVGKIAAGDYDVTVAGKLEGSGVEDFAFTPVTAKIKVIDRLTIDENSTTAPEAATGIDLKVKRTIKANEWSTICLPFAMTEAQVKAAFGDKVQLADFTGYDYDEDADELKVKFTTGVTAIEANRSYIIKVEKAVNEFTVDNVDVAPALDDSKVKKSNPAAFRGNYEAETVLDDGCLFISGNKFFYSTGKTKIKAFRGYFEFYDELDNRAVASRVVFVFDETTGIKNAKIASEDKVFDLQGRQVENAGKGVYIVGGKKVVVK